MISIKDYSDEEVQRLLERWTENTLKSNPELVEKSPIDILLEKEAIKRVYLQSLLDINSLQL